MGRGNLFWEERCYWNANPPGQPFLQGLFNDEELGMVFCTAPCMQITANHTAQTPSTPFSVSINIFGGHTIQMQFIWKQSQNSRGISASFGMILTGKQTCVSRYNWGLIALLDSLYSIYPIMWITLESTLEGPLETLSNSAHISEKPPGLYVQACWMFPKCICCPENICAIGSVKSGC